MAEFPGMKSLNSQYFIFTIRSCFSILVAIIVIQKKTVVNVAQLHLLINIYSVFVVYDVFFFKIAF